MLKKLISALIALAMISPNVLANSRDVYVLASGEVITEDSNDTASGKSTEEQKSSNAAVGKEIKLDSTGLEHTDTHDNSVPIVEKNKTKNNEMLNTELSISQARSRYSSERVMLSPDIGDTKYQEAAEVLGALGIMVGDAESGLFRPDDNILRSEMAKVSVYSVGMEDVAARITTPTRFPDVVENHWANGAINVADQQGMVIGDDVGTFRPDDNVLFQEAVTIMVRALGYEPQAASNGGYPNGYMVTASSIQLLKGISAAASEPAKRGDVAQLVFNALTINMMEQTGFGTNVSYEVGKKTLLYDRLNVEKGYGQIKATSETGIDGGNNTSDDRILINDITFVEGKTTAKQLLGYNVVYYARIDTNSDEKTLILVKPQDSKNKTLRIDAENISDITGSAETDKVLTYWETTASNSTKTATIVAEPIYILNGKYTKTVDISKLKIETGNLILLDTDVNNIYDIVFINELTNLVVDTVSTVTGRITDKYNSGSLLLDKENESVDFAIVYDDYDIELSELKEWDVISYTVSEDKKLIKAYVSRDSILGTVTQITDDGIKIDKADGIYEIAKSYPNEINIRDKGRFYLDIEGKIAAVDENASFEEDNAGRGSYAYLVNAAISGTVDEVLQFKLFNTSGQTVVLDGANKMRLGSEYGLSAKKMLEAMGKDGNVTPQLITYETNAAGKVTGIDMAVDVTETGTPNIKKFSKNISASDQVYKSASSKVGNVTVADTTLIFDIPEGSGTDTAKYAMRTKAVFSNDTPYDILVYDLQEDYTAKVIIVTSTTGIANPESPIVIVTEMATGQNDEYETIDIASGYEDGKAVELSAADTEVFVKSGKKLETGDVFQYNTNADGAVDSITLLLDQSKKDTEFTEEVTPELTTVYGCVVKKFTNSVNIDVNGEVKNYSTANAMVYLFNSSRKNNKVTVVSPADIEIYEEGNPVRLFLKLYKDEVKEAVIVK